MEKINLQKAQEMMENCFEKSINYNNVIISIGYVSFFTILFLVKDSINLKDLHTIIVYILISLFFYIFWIIGNMIVQSIIVIKACWQFLTDFWKRCHMIVWPIFLCITIIPALIACVLLASTLLNNIKTI